jgi:hypothetical protein
MRFLAGQKVQQFQCKKCGHLMRGNPQVTSHFPTYESM